MTHSGPRKYSLLRLNLEIALVQQPPPDHFVCEPISIFCTWYEHDRVRGAEHRIYPMGPHRMYDMPEAEGGWQWIHSKADNVRQYWSVPRHSVYGSETTAISNVGPTRHRTIVTTCSIRFAEPRNAVCMPTVFVCRCVDGMVGGVEQQHRPS